MVSKSISDRLIEGISVLSDKEINKLIAVINFHEFNYHSVIIDEYADT